MTNAKAQCAAGFAVQVLREHHALSREDVALYWTRLYGATCCTADAICKKHTAAVAQTAREIQRMERCSQLVFDRAQAEHTERDWIFRVHRYAELTKVLNLASECKGLDEFDARILREKEEARTAKLRERRETEQHVGEQLAKKLRYITSAREGETLMRNAMHAVDKAHGNTDLMFLHLGAALGRIRAEQIREAVDAGLIDAATISRVPEVRCHDDDSR